MYLKQNKRMDAPPEGDRSVIIFVYSGLTGLLTPTSNCFLNSAIFKSSWWKYMLQNRGEIIDP